MNDLQANSCYILVITILLHKEPPTLNCTSQQAVNIHTSPERSSLPVVIVMCEASEARQAAVVSLPLPLLHLPFLLPPADLVVQLGLPVYLLHGLPVAQKRERITKQHHAKMTSALSLFWCQ